MLDECSKLGIKVPKLKKFQMSSLETAHLGFHILLRVFRLVGDFWISLYFEKRNFARFLLHIKAGHM